MHHIIETVRGYKMIINVLGNEEGAHSFHAFASIDLLDGAAAAASRSSGCSSISE
jgi:hypothetical protein